MTIKTIKELMKTNAFVNLDGTIECVNAFEEMMAYYYGLKNHLTKSAEENDICNNAIVELSLMADAMGFSSAEARREARNLASRTMGRTDARKLLKAA